MKNILTAILFLGTCLFSAHGADATHGCLLRDSMPQTWELDQQYFQTTPSEDPWWRSFNDPVLTALVRRAVVNNYNVQAAQRRIEMARQASRVTKAGYWPEISVDAGWDAIGTAPTVHGSHAHETDMRYFQLGLSMNWEIDVFGRIHAQAKADKAAVEASVADYDATLVSLCSNLAKAYFQLRMAQAELDVAERNVAVAEKQQKLAQARFDAGLRPAVDVVQARMLVAQTKVTQPPLQADISTAVNEIALLVGEYPDSLLNLREAFPLPSTPPPGFVGDPQTLLRRRPDVVAAERQLAVTAAKIGIAKKDFLPTLSLTASAGTQGVALTDMFGRNSFNYRVAPMLSWTVFDGMARNARLAEARLEMEAQIDAYNLTVMTAVTEVNNAMLSWQSLSDQFVYQEMLLRDARRQLELQTDRYTQGLADFSDLATAQTSVLQYENSLVQTHASQLAALVTLYTALGGGF